MFNLKIFKAYLDSSKPRVVLLMVFTSFIGMLLANPISLNLKVLFFGNLGIALMSLSAGSINQLLDQSIDKIMQPEPTPISKILILFFCFVKVNTFSTSISVSGRGIKVSFVTKNSEFQKNFLLVK